MDEQAAIQRVRDALEQGPHTHHNPNIRFVLHADLAALLAAHAALVEAARWLIDELQAPDDEYRLNEADKAMDAVIALLATAAPQPAASPAATDVREGT